MTDQAAYRRYTAEAEKALTTAGQNMSAQDRLSWTRLGNAWATLALAAAQERVQPADRPLPSPPVLIDRDGDRWLLDDEGRYVAELDRRDVRHREDVEAAYGPLREPGT